MKNKKVIVLDGISSITSSVVIIGKNQIILSFRIVNHCKKNPVNMDKMSIFLIQLQMQSLDDRLDLWGNVTQQLE